MKIGIIGSGIVGKTLAAGFIKHGHEVMAASRSPQKINDWKNEISDKLKIGNFSEAAAFADLIVLATKGSAASDALKLAGEEHLAGKTVMDATNPIADAAPVNGVLQFFTDMNYSLMEKLQEEFPKAHFVKVFNSVGAARMVNPEFELKPTMFICGNSDESKQTVTEVLDKFGWETEDMGSVEAARAIEPLCILWCIPGFTQNRWTHAFKMLK